MKILQYLFLALILLTTNVLSHAADHKGDMSLLQDSEGKTLDISKHIYSGEFTVAAKKLQSLIAEDPDFGLAQRIYTELIATPPINASGSSDDWLAPDNNEIARLVDEVRQRYTNQMLSEAYTTGKIPEFLLQLSPSQKQVVVIDSSLSRAFIFQHKENQLALVNDHYVTVGKNGVSKGVEGDNRTPLGVYFITSRLNPLGLDDLYGDGALPLNYPNEWDQRLGHSGFGIWLHGVPSNIDKRAPFATRGCVAFPNKDISLLYNTPEIENSPVIITQGINWVDPAQIMPFRSTLSSQIDAWKNTWEDGDIEEIKAYYAVSFSNGSRNRTNWLQSQDAILAQAGTNNFELSDLSMFKYPGAPEMVVVSFNKEYADNDADQNERIRQYWQLDEHDVWRIVYQGSAQYQPVHFKGIPDAVRPTLADEVQRRADGVGS
jgi:murein L,D-transpeptidase YafK